MGREEDRKRDREAYERRGDAGEDRLRDRDGDRYYKESERDRERDRDRDRDRGVRIYRENGGGRNKDRERERERYRDKSPDELDYKEKNKGRDRHKDKNREKDKDKHKSSKKRKEKRRKKEREHKKYYSSSESSSSTDSESDDGGLSQLEREREAVDTLRDILGKYGAAKKEIREMLFRIDDGEAVSVSNVPDPELRSWIQKMLEMLGLRQSRKGLFALSESSRHGSKTLSILGSVFFEPPRPPRPSSSSSAPSVGADSVGRDKEGIHTAPLSTGDGGRGADGHASDRGGRPKEGDGDRCGAEESGGRQSLAREGGEEEDAGRGGRKASEPLASVGLSEDQHPDAAEPVRKAIRGPVMPPKELLEAAAAAAAAMEAAGELNKSRSDGLYDDEDVAGPMPFGGDDEDWDLDSVPENAREAEVLRIMKAIKEVADEARRHPSPPGQTAAEAAAAAVPNPYLVLNVDAKALTPEIKRRYLRLSLLIHPDKCSHPHAHTAFQAAADAAKILQDPDLRKAMDERIEDRQLRKMAAEAAEAEERRREWAEVMKNPQEREASRAAAAAAAAANSRASWMTDIIQERRVDVSATLAQKSVTAFRQKTVTSGGDQSMWTDTPEQRRAKEAQFALEAASASFLAIGAGEGASAKAAEAGYGGAAFGGQKSLVEQHKEQQAKLAKEARKAAKAAATAAAASGSGSGSSGAPESKWKSFDRERDLKIPPRTAGRGGAAEFLRGAGNLNSMFGSGSNKFL